jgi:glucan phosphoethanolaminetransferase (alkaline phosphatase superfamily)
MFHFVWILWQKTPDLPMFLYLLSIALISLVYIIAVFKFYKDYQTLTKQLESHISKLFGFAYSINIKKQIKEEHQKEVGVKRIKVTREIHE